VESSVDVVSAEATEASPIHSAKSAHVRFFNRLYSVSRVDMAREGDERTIAENAGGRKEAVCGSALPPRIGQFAGTP
jgi:hypothetical protein